MTNKRINYTLLMRFPCINFIKMIFEIQHSGLFSPFYIFDWFHSIFNLPRHSCVEKKLWNILIHPVFNLPLTTRAKGVKIKRGQIFSRVQYLVLVVKLFIPSWVSLKETLTIPDKIHGYWAAVSTVVSNIRDIIFIFITSS